MGVAGQAANTTLYEYDVMQAYINIYKFSSCANQSLGNMNVDAGKDYVCRMGMLERKTHQDLWAEGAPSAPTQSS